MNRGNVYERVHAGASIVLYYETNERLFTTRDLARVTHIETVHEVIITAI